MKNMQGYKTLIFCEFNTSLLPKVEKAMLDCIALDVRQLVGCYKGVKSTSYMLRKDKTDMVELRKVLNRHHQESILLVDNQRQGYLLFQQDGYDFGKHTVKLGRFRVIGRHQAIKDGNYTYDVEADKFYGFN